MILHRPRLTHPSKKIIAGNFCVYPSPESGPVGFTDFSVQARLSLTVVLETTIYICNKKAISPRLKIPSGYSLS